MKPVLAFETSSPVLSIALSTSGHSILEKTVNGFFNHAENLLPVTDQLLKNKKTSLAAVKTLLIGRGPGSFTGLRVGYATLKGFTALAKKNCYGALSLDLIAENISLPEGSHLCVCLGANREKVYSRLYRRVKEKWKPLHKPSVIAFQDWIDHLPAGTSLVGDAAHHYRAQIEAAPKKGLRILPEKSGMPKASTLIRLYKKAPQKLQKLKTPKDFLPLYFRLSEAEEKRKSHVHSR